MLSGSDVVWLSYELRGLENRAAVLDFVILSFFGGYQYSLSRSCQSFALIEMLI